MIWHLVWLFWLGFMLVADVIAETTGPGKGHTFTEFWQRFIGLHQALTPALRVRRMAILAGVAILAAHLMTGWV